MTIALESVALPAQGIVDARVSRDSSSEVTVRFDDPAAAVRFAVLLREEIKPHAERYHHVIINEEVGDRCFAHHFVLISTEADSPSDLAELMAATIDGEPDEDEGLPEKTERGYVLDFGARVTSVLRLKEVTRMEGELLAKMLPVRRADEMTIQETECDSPAGPAHRG